MLAKQDNAKKSASTFGKSLLSLQLHEVYPILRNVLVRKKKEKKGEKKGIFLFKMIDGHG